MKYYLYMDECGNHVLSLTDSFPVFLLCGVLISQDNYELLRDRINKVKYTFWGYKEVIFHSRDIRKCEKEFVILFDKQVKDEFYRSVNDIITDNDYTVIAAAIRKTAYIEKSGRFSNDVYEVSLSSVIDRDIIFLDNIPGPEKELEVIIERRGRKEDKQLEEHFQHLLATGTENVSAEKLSGYQPTITFKSKKENINGLQLADLVAYPLAKHVMEPEKNNPAFDVVKNKICLKDGERYGLRIYP